MRRKSNFFWHFLDYALFSCFMGRNSPNDLQKFSTLAVSKILGATSSLPNLTIIGAQSRPYPKNPNKSNFNTCISAGKNSVYDWSPNAREQNANQWRTVKNITLSWCNRESRSNSRNVRLACIGLWNGLLYFLMATLFPVRLSSDELQK